MRKKMATDRVLELEKKQTNLKTYIISILIFIAGIGLLYWSKLDAMKKYPAAQAVIRDLGGLFVVSIAITLIWELCAKRAFSDELLTKANISQQISRSGLIHLVHNPHEINGSIRTSPGLRFKYFIKDKHFKANNIGTSFIKIQHKCFIFNTYTFLVFFFFLNFSSLFQTFPR
jgi:NAD/NADP transhydrogenase beta subunit